ncbi:MAG: PH domain-containing protein [Candidatus Omnitrophica bacterium]|nr:PH domain-containing protein [Candidatus Omnitrophota bacterium]
MKEEEIVWQGPSSQIINFGTYFMCGLLACLAVLIFIALGRLVEHPARFLVLGLLLVPLGAVFWKWTVNRCRHFEVTSERIRITTGVFSRRTDELELYRVKDITLIRPFMYRFWGLGNLVLTTNDSSTPTLTLEAIPNVQNLHEQLRKDVETCRERKKVRLAELE